MALGGIAVVWNTSFKSLSFNHICIQFMASRLIVHSPARSISKGVFPCQ
jgi:hypothetical protein